MCRRLFEFYPSLSSLLQHDAMNNNPNKLRQFQSTFFKALSSPVRLAILDELRSGEKTVTEIKSKLLLDSANVSQQLAVLKAERIVTGERRGANIFYSCTDQAIFFLLDASKVVFHNNLERMEKLLEST